MDAGKRAANDYVKNEAKFLAINLFILAGAVGVVALLFICFLTTRQQKDDRTRAALQAIAQAATSYRAKNERFPDSMDQLGAFVIESSAPAVDRLPSKDPWEQDYVYIKLSDDRIAIASAGRNGSLDTSRATLSEPPENSLAKISTNEIWRFGIQNDDWIYLAGSWAQKTEDRQRETDN